MSYMDEHGENSLNKPLTTNYNTYTYLLIYFSGGPEN